jgi:hypothetical protein
LEQSIEFTVLLLTLNLVTSDHIITKKRMAQHYPFKCGLLMQLWGFELCWMSSQGKLTTKTGENVSLKPYLFIPVYRMIDFSTKQTGDHAA